MNTRRVKIKMCGMFRPADIDVINELRPDYCGFVVNFPKSHRSVSEEQLKFLRNKLSDGIVPVGVFVDEPADRVIRLLDEGLIDIAQLHGNEDDETAAFIRETTGKQVIRAFRASAYRESGCGSTTGPADRGEGSGASERHDELMRIYSRMLAEAASSPADMVLLDSGQGSGVTMDFRLLKEAIEETGFRRPWFLAGGLDLSNIPEALNTLEPYAIDLSGGLETDRLKDSARMRAVMEMVRAL